MIIMIFKNMPFLNYLCLLSIRFLLHRFNFGIPLQSSFMDFGTTERLSINCSHSCQCCQAMAIGGIKIPSHFFFNRYCECSNIFCHLEPIEGNSYNQVQYHWHRGEIQDRGCHCSRCLCAVSILKARGRYPNGITAETCSLEGRCK